MKVTYKEAPYDGHLQRNPNKVNLRGQTQWRSYNSEDPDESKLTGGPNKGYLTGVLL